MNISADDRLKDVLVFIEAAVEIHERSGCWGKDGSRPVRNVYLKGVQRNRGQVPTSLLFHSSHTQWQMTPCFYKIHDHSPEKCSTAMTQKQGNRYNRV